ncbi:MAG: nucleotide exchange factor GrpE [Ruminococcus sp.]|nr:nucleotide exchange factor GrpE [Ruminococcus sp.]
MKIKKGGKRPMGSEKETEKTEQAEEIKEDACKKEDNQEPEKEEVKKEKSQEEILSENLKDSQDKYLRLMAEYDNFRKRSAKERLEINANATANVIGEILPVFDNFERALQTETTDESYKAGVEMIFNQFNEMLKKLNVEIIDPTGETFDPNIANAVNQIEDPELGENVVAQTFQKGCKIGDKVIRYAMVVVANP